MAALLLHVDQHDALNGYSQMLPHVLSFAKGK
jgi:prephenate dehydrogenase